MRHRDVSAPDEPAIIVLPGATDIRPADIYDGQESYRVLTSYPAEPAIAEIQARLRGLGWHPRAVDFMNPGGSSATAAKWGALIIDGKSVDAWSQQWENAAGEVVWYGLRYFDRERDIHAPLNVIVSFFHSDTVKTLSAGPPRQ